MSFSPPLGPVRCCARKTSPVGWAGAVSYPLTTNTTDPIPTPTLARRLGTSSRCLCRQAVYLALASFALSTSPLRFFLSLELLRTLSLSLPLMRPRRPCLSSRAAVRRGPWAKSGLAHADGTAQGQMFVARLPLAPRPPGDLSSTSHPDGPCPEAPLVPATQGLPGTSAVAPGAMPCLPCSYHVQPTPPILQHNCCSGKGLPAPPQAHLFRWFGCCLWAEAGAT